MEKTLPDATYTLHLRCHIYVLKTAWGQPGHYVTEGSSQMRACLGLCSDGQPGLHALAPCLSMMPPSILGLKNLSSQNE